MTSDFKFKVPTTVACFFTGCKKPPSTLFKDHDTNDYLYLCHYHYTRKYHARKKQVDESNEHKNVPRMKYFEPI